VARRELTGVLLVGGASTRFGSPKALARYEGETLAERAWRLLGETCDERIAVGKAEHGLPFDVVTDGTDIRAPIAGVVAGLRVARYELVVVIPVDMPLLTAAALRELADRCLDVAYPQTGPLPGAYRRTALASLQEALGRGELSLRRAVRGLDAAVVTLEERILLNVNEPADLDKLG
jgi:molybdopterin-guanine dinucleotide biosynthesis protein A